MKSQFPGFYPLSTKEFETLWANAIFIFDTNVLLNLYRYPEEARDDLISRITQLADRIWLPYNVGLEYQRNRLAVVAEQKRRFRDVRQAIDASIGSLRGEFDRLQLKKRHSTIDVDGFLTDVDNTVAKFYSNLDSLESSHPSPQDPDPVRDKIDELFDGKIGPAFAKQECLDAIYIDGAKRYANRVPPGYSDLPKGKPESEDIFQYGSLVYRRQYGDLMIWHQIISHAKELNIQNIVLVTDDEKEDWWYRIESEGKKTIGPRPELVSEIRHVANVSLFHMYNSEQFLRRASEFLNVPVPEAAIEQVQEAKRTIRHLNSDIMSTYRAIEQSVENWLVDRFGRENVIVQERGFPIFL